MPNTQVSDWIDADRFFTDFGAKQERRAGRTTDMLVTVAQCCHYQVLSMMVVSMTAQMSRYAQRAFLGHLERFGLCPTRVTNREVDVNGSSIMFVGGSEPIKSGFSGPVFRDFD